MKLFRRHGLYLVWFGESRGYLYDPATDAAGPDVDPRRVVGTYGVEWLPVPDDALIPLGLLRHLVLPFPE